MLSDNDKQDLLNSFPNIELSYETIVHNKVHNANIFIAIPEGNKYFTWFTVFKKQNICVLMEITDNKKICDIQIVHCCFHDHLAYGTIFYGTLFKYNYHRFFSVEDILYYKGNSCSSFPFFDKLQIMENMFSREIQQIALTNKSVVFGIPVLTSSIHELMNTITSLPYKIKYIQFRNNKIKLGNEVFNLVYSINCINDTVEEYKAYKTQITRENKTIKHPVQKNSNKTQPIVFQIKPDIQNDIYHLFTNEEEENSFYGIAYIPGYKTSVMMNKLFRKIKENNNLDALEESDDEEEFENDNEDKYVYLDRTYNMVCEYNYKFKKWTPIRIAQENEKVITNVDLIRLEKNNY
jgi:hypothetical protein